MSESVAEALKWVIVVLVAGFIGYFGRYLAMILIRKMGKEKSETRNGIIKERSDKAEKSKYKLEKKRSKLEVKKLKKG